jgi:hypothetical protein
MHKNTFMKHEKLSSIHYLIVNISDIDGDSLEDGALSCTTWSETKYTMEVSIDGDESGGGGGW